MIAIRDVWLVRSRHGTFQGFQLDEQVPDAAREQLELPVNYFQVIDFFDHPVKF